MSADLELCYMTADEAIGRFRDGSLSPVELVKSLIDRTGAVDPKVNAYTYSFFDRALDQARAAETRYRGGDARPLEGVPIVIKDGHDVAGEITTYGSRLYEHHRPEVSEFHVERILGAGAILFARSATPEFGIATVCHSELWGVTRNPWNLDLSPAGSGGGAGAALAGGMTTLANGGDYGGSIRNPASACGAVGFKPPAGRVPGRPAWNLNAWFSFGPLARSVADAALLQNVISGQHPSDLTSLPQRMHIPERLDDIGGWRIGLSPDLGFFEIDPEVAASTRAAAEAFRELGCTVEEVAVPWTERTLEAALVYYGHMVDFDPNAMMPEERALLTDYARRDKEYFAGRTDMSLWESTEVRGEMYAGLEPIFRRCDVLLCPTLALPSVPAELHPIDGKVLINGKRVDPTFGWTLCYPFNMLSQLPVISVPSGLASNGVPTGLQIVGRPFDDVSVFRAAAAFEGVRPWSNRRPNL